MCLAKLEGLEDVDFQRVVQYIFRRLVLTMDCSVTSRWIVSEL